MSRRILVVEDEPDVRRLVRRVLESGGFEVIEAVEGRAALRSVHDHRPDLVVLDVGLPGLDGWAVLERIRDVTDTPVVMLTAHASEIDRVRGLRSGADDYVTKPFGRGELLARVEAVLRRTAGGRGPREVYDDGVVEIDYRAHRVRVRGTEVRLSPLEFRLLDTLVQHPNQVLAPPQLLELVWGSSRSRSESQVKLYVGYLRRKLADEHGHTPIETVRGFGYRYAPSASAT